jgi:hypothetical protein
MAEGYKILAGKSDGERPLAGLNLDGKIILKLCSYEGVD